MAGTYVQVQPDSTGKKVQVFENTLDGTNAVEAQAAVLVDAQGLAKSTLANPNLERNLPVEELLQAILFQLKLMNFYMCEVNPRILRDEPNAVEQDVAVNQSSISLF